MKKCLLVSGGEFSPISDIDSYNLIIACDKGYEHCKKMKTIPDIVIGDLDSCTIKIDHDIKLKKLNPIKDDTDTISAVRYALSNGYDQIDICCAFGGRFDHSIANIQTAAFIMEHGAKTCITGKDTMLFSINNESISIPKKDNCYLSVFSLSNKSTGVSITGTKYEVSNITLTNTYPIGTSNEWANDNASISVENGMLIAVISKNVKIH